MESQEWEDKWRARKGKNRNGKVEDINGKRNGEQEKTENGKLGMPEMLVHSMEFPAQDCEGGGQGYHLPL